MLSGPARWRWSRGDAGYPAALPTATCENRVMLAAGALYVLGSGPPGSGESALAPTARRFDSARTPDALQPAAAS